MGLPTDSELVETIKPFMDIDDALDFALILSSPKTMEQATTSTIVCLYGTDRNGKTTLTRKLEDLLDHIRLTPEPALECPTYFTRSNVILYSVNSEQQVSIVKEFCNEYETDFLRINCP